jgi:hypothetical protein
MSASLHGCSTTRRSFATRRHAARCYPWINHLRLTSQRSYFQSRTLKHYPLGCLKTYDIRTIRPKIARYLTLSTSRGATSNTLHYSSLLLPYSSFYSNSKSLTIPPSDYVTTFPGAALIIDSTNLEPVFRITIRISDCCVARTTPTPLSFPLIHSKPIRIRTTFYAVHLLY